MSSIDEPAGRHYVEVETDGQVYWGYTSVPPPETPCCVDGLRGLPAQAMTGAAFHEAGHAVAAFHAGMPATAAEITAMAPCSRCGAPKARGRNIGMNLGICAAQDTLLVLAAGVQAELLWAETQGHLSDAHRWAIEVGGLDDQGVARFTALSIVVVWEPLDYGPAGADPRPWNWPHQEHRARTTAVAWWPQIEAVATQLQLTTQLSDAEVLKILESVPIGHADDIAAYGVG